MFIGEGFGDFLVEVLNIVGIIGMDYGVGVVCV